MHDRRGIPRLINVIANKALMLVGAGLIGAGGFVLYKGRANPQIVVGPRVLGVRKQVSW